MTLNLVARGFKIIPLARNSKIATNEPARVKLWGNNDYNIGLVTGDELDGRQGLKVDVAGSIKKLGKGTDLKSDGGRVVAPGSVVNSRAYEGVGAAPESKTGKDADVWVLRP